MFVQISTRISIQLSTKKRCRNGEKQATVTPRPLGQTDEQSLLLGFHDKFSFIVIINHDSPPTAGASPRAFIPDGTRIRARLFPV